MGTVGRKVAAAAAAGVLLGVLTACSSGGSATSRDAAKGGASATAGAASGQASAAAASPAGSASAPAGGAAATGGGASAAAGSPGASGTAGAPAGGASTPGAGGGSGTGGALPAPTADSDALVLDEKLLLQLLPDGKAMTGWEEEKRRVDSADHATTCSGSGACSGKPLSGTARFSLGEVTARFAIDTLPTKAAAKEKLAEVYASYADGNRYRAVDIVPLGSEYRAFQGQLAGRDGVSIVLRSGTLVAAVTTEGGPADPAATRRLAVMLVQRIEQAQAGRIPDAALGAA
ncbi:hypothetical protein [Kitasatospora sp. A2-31]|uniref:hypothetical protein n=1 Tax=Kitasatospora sp. A2-31 TaxID=2916414 RepID=UPI001EEB350D|nr:hypothetical protein [Kitasatospora sp. A2-31]MCG6498110.1 hypothetical protein [Kitasatospora sp. A2-31]